MEYYLEDVLCSEATWPEGLFESPRSSLDLAEHAFVSKSFTEYQHHFNLPFTSQEAAIIGARVSHRLATERKCLDDTAALPIYCCNGLSRGITGGIYQRWTPEARERERLRQLSESLQRVMCLGAALKAIPVAELKATTPGLDCDHVEHPSTLMIVFIHDDDESEHESDTE